MKAKLWIVLGLAAAILLGGCDTSGNVPDAALGDLSDMVKTPSGLLFKIMVPSNGRIALAGDTVSVLYLGSLVNGKVFDASQHNIPFSFVLGAGTVIKGWDEGVAGMRIGETRKLIIPPNLGYGATGNASIPPNSTLIFMVRLLNIQ